MSIESGGSDEMKELVMEGNDCIIMDVVASIDQLC